MHGGYNGGGGGYGGGGGGAYGGGGGGGGYGGARGGYGGGGAAQHQQQQQQQQQAIAPDQLKSLPVQPIVSLTPFTGGKWWIRVRVSDKSAARTWNKPNSTGKLFSCTFVDDTSSIRATFFNEAVDMFEHALVPGDVYYVCGGSVKAANRKFNTCNNEYELSFDGNAQVHKAVGENTSMIPKERYNFVPINFLAAKEKDTLVDVLAVVMNVGEMASFVAKASGDQLTKRNVTVADQSNAVNITLWRDQATAFTLPRGTVVAIKNLKVSGFDGLSLTATGATTMDVGLKIAEVQKLQTWFSSTEGKNVENLTKGREEMQVVRESKFIFFDDIERLGLGKSEQGDYVDVRISPIFIKTEPLWYDACPKCKKKVLIAQGVADSANAVGRCEKCQCDVASDPRYMVTIQASDGVAVRWVTFFDEAGTSFFFGMPAVELKRHMLQDQGFASQLAHKRLNVPFVARLKVREERFSDKETMKLTCVGIADFTNFAWNNKPESRDPALAAGGPKPKSHYSLALRAQNQQLIKEISMYHH